MFQLIKFEDNLYGINVNGKLHLGTKFKAGDFCIDNLNANADDVCEVMAAFSTGGQNFADFGISGGWTFIDTRDVSKYLPALPEMGVA